MTSLLTSADAVLNPPTALEDNLRFRAELLNGCLDSPELRSDVLSLSAKDIIWTFNTLFWTKDPRKGAMSDQPFILYGYERDTLLDLDRRLREGKDLLIEKSRDVGATWTILDWLLWHWRFDASFNAIVGSRLEDLIDEKGNLDTHFERLRWQCRHLPEWWLPHKFDAEKHIALTFSERRHIPFMRMMRPDSDNTIVGEAVTENFSRQGRYNVAFLDEFAACEQAEGAWVATADSTPMRVPVSTPKGLGNTFARLRRSKTIDVRSLHWSLHPEKSKGLYCQTHKKLTPDCAWPTCKLRSPWYDAECQRRGADPLSIAQELDIDYLGAGNPYLDLNALALQVAEEPVVRGYLVEVDHGVELRADGKGPWLFWELPPPKKLGSAEPVVPSIIGGDVAEGIGGDYSVAVVRDRQNRGMKARLRTHMDTDQFAWELIKAGRFYHQAWVVCERNGPGFAVNSELLKHYGNVFYEMAIQKVGMPQTKRFGWNTQARSKELMLTQLREEVRTGAAAMRDAVLIEEGKTLITDEDGKVHADSGYFDDELMAWSIAGAAMQLIPFQPPGKKRRPEPIYEGTNLAG